jgi:hypothetical protein
VNKITDGESKTQRASEKAPKIVIIPLLGNRRSALKGSAVVVQYILQRMRYSLAWDEMLSLVDFSYPTMVKM